MIQPAYVEAWDSHDFPEHDVRGSSGEPALFHQRVVLTRGIAAPGTPDEGQEVWLVIKGHALVAKSMTELGGGDNDRSSDVERWLANARIEDRQRQKAWMRGREKELASRPDIAALLDDSPEKLYDRAVLSEGQRVAMRLFCQTDSEGQYKGYGQIAKELGIEKDSARDRVEAAIDKILAIGQVDAD